MSNLYDKIDDRIMKGVNAGVRAWNWTTGKTKSDLANGLLTAASILESVGWINNGGYLFIPLSLFTSYIFQEDNLNMEKAEENAVRSGLKDCKVESSKKKNKFLAIVCLPNCPCYALAHSNNGKILPDTKITNYSLAIGFGMRAASHYVICADHLPPRKNVFSRASNKIKEWARNRVQQPAGVPAPAYRRITLEEQLA